MDRQEAQLWLMAALGQAEPAPHGEGWQRLKQLLLNGAAPSRACKQLLQVACEERPDLVRLHCFHPAAYFHLQSHSDSCLVALQVAACVADLPSIARNLFQSECCLSSVQGSCLTVLALYPATLSPAAGSHQCIQTWFGCFLGDSIGRFKFGARALSQYALANRARVGPPQTCLGYSAGLRGCCPIIASLICAGGCFDFHVPAFQSQLCLLSHLCLRCL